MNIDGQIGNKYQTIQKSRPFDFGTDAIERQRVSLGQSLIDADFEYGLQATKWQTHTDTRKFISFNEIPGTDIPFSNVTSSDISKDSTGRIVTVNIPSGTFGTNYNYPLNGQYISVQGLNTQGANAQGIYQVIGSNLPSTGNQNISFLARGNVSIYATSNIISLPTTTVRRCVVMGSSYANTSPLYSPINTINVASIQINPVIPFIPTPPSTLLGQSSVANVTIYTQPGSYHGVLPGMSLYIANTVAYNTTSNVIFTNSNIGGQYYLVSSVPNANTIVLSNLTLSSQFCASLSNNTILGAAFTSSNLNFQTSSTFMPNVYVTSTGYALHRPYDGGVLITNNNPGFGISFVRQSKKVFRYQSGKGLLWSSGTLFCPNNDITSLSASAITPGSVITVTCVVPHGAPQAGALIQIKGVVTPGWNGYYTINSVLDLYSFTVLASTNLTVTSPNLGEQPRFVITNWTGASVRVGCFDDQNGIFWEFDGTTLWTVKRTSTLQIAGTVNVSVGSQRMIGIGTRFQDQFKINDKFVLKGMTFAVVATPSQTELWCSPPFRSSLDCVSGQICKIKDIRVPQNQFNRDTIDGNGQSGFKFNPGKMQMVGIQYTWYGAGFVDFMMRGTDGNWVYANRMRQNNVNDEAYMRTGNMPVRYEIVNEMSHATAKLSAQLGTSDTSASLTENINYWPSTGTVLVDNELIRYNGKTTNTLTGLTHASNVQYSINNTQLQLTGSPATTHLLGNTAVLFTTTCSPSLTHWGSAFLIDGSFDNDRGYLFNYQINSAAGGVIVTAPTNLFMIRLSPSVSNGIVGDIGSRELLNRAQLLLQRLDVWVQTLSDATAGAKGAGSAIVSGILNPYFYIGTASLNMTPNNLVNVNSMNWIPINSAINSSALQPSFAQVTTDCKNFTYVAGTGERIFSTICNAGSQYSIDLGGLKEICCNTVGGNNVFPDGPDTLLIQIQGSINSTLGSLAAYSLNLFWGEAQA